jgi:hypothetical protein
MMTMADSDESLSVNIDDLQKGGVNLKYMAEIAASIHNDLKNKIAGLTLGDDQISQLIMQNYKPGEKASLEFLDNLRALIDGHGGETIDLSKIFNDVNTDTVNEVSTPTEHGTTPGIKAH